MSSSSVSKHEIDTLMRAPDPERTYPSLSRVQADYVADPCFIIRERTYQQQFSDMYFLRLAKLRPVVSEVAMAAWSTTVVSGEEIHHVDRVLNVRQGEMCWILGTVYMDMPLKPNILDDITKDHWIAAPPPRTKYIDEKTDQIMLEDESGRLRLVGSILPTQNLVTGCVIAVMGSETHNGDFKVVNMIIPDLAPQPKLLGEMKKQGKKVALCSGLGFRGNVKEGYQTELLAEWLLGEIGDEEDQKSASSIVRLILAGNSLGTPLAIPLAFGEERAKKYGYDASTYDASPALALDNFLSQLLPSLPVTIMPGAADPANVSLPQQPLHAAIFPAAKQYGGSTFDRGTNPWTAEVDGVTFLGTSGQTLDDVYKYVEGDDRLGMAERLLRWRLVAPTAPDTLWSYPFRERDQFVIDECPHVFFVGNQPEFKTSLLKGEDGQQARVVLIPKFSKTGQIVVVDLDTLDVEVVRFGLQEQEQGEEEEEEVKKEEEGSGEEEKEEE